jgi:hypothetical protein
VQLNNPEYFADSETSDGQQRSSEASSEDGFGDDHHIDDKLSIPDASSARAAFKPVNEPQGRVSSRSSTNTSGIDSIQDSPERRNEVASVEVASAIRHDQAGRDTSPTSNEWGNGAQGPEVKSGSVAMSDASVAAGRPAGETKIYQNETDDDDGIGVADVQHATVADPNDEESDHETQAIAVNDDAKITESMLLVDAGYDAEDSQDAVSEEEDERPNEDAEILQEEASVHVNHSAGAVNICFEAPITASS